MLNGMTGRRMTGRHRRTGTASKYIYMYVVYIMYMQLDID